MFSCDICDYSSSTKDGLFEHKRQSHDGNPKKKQYSCEHCNSKFEDYISRRETRGREKFYCSKECKHKGDESEKFYFNCAECGSEVVKTQSLVDQMGDYEINNHFCDKECESKYKKENWVGEDHPGWKENDVLMSCDHCGDDIKVNQYYVGKLKNHFCDHECHTEFQIEQKYDDCEYCGEEFELTQNQRMSSVDNHFCSINHWRKWMSDIQTGDKNNAWSGGNKRYYGPGWSKIRSSVVKRDSFECKNCGMSRQDHYNKFGCDLDVHHIKPLRTFDDYNLANKTDNLVSLCKMCHGKAEHGKIEIDKPAVSQSN